MYFQLPSSIRRWQRRWAAAALDSIRAQSQWRSSSDAGDAGRRQRAGGPAEGVWCGVQWPLCTEAGSSGLHQMAVNRCPLSGSSGCCSMLQSQAHQAEADSGAVVTLVVHQQRGAVNSAQACGFSPAAASRPHHPLQGGAPGPPLLQGGSRRVCGGARCRRPAARRMEAAASVRRMHTTVLESDP